MCNFANKSVAPTAPLVKAVSSATAMLVTQAVKAANDSPQLSVPEVKNTASKLCHV